jgi:hypothetical protein
MIASTSFPRDCEAPVAEFNEPAAARKSCSLVENAEGHAVAELAEVFDHLLEVLVHGVPIFNEAAYRVASLKDARTGDASQTASGLQVARPPSKSRRLKASTLRRRACSKWGVVDSSSMSSLSRSPDQNSKSIRFPRGSSSALCPQAIPNFGDRHSQRRSKEDLPSK